MSAGFVDNFAAWLAPQRSATLSAPSGRRGDPPAATTTDALFAYMDQMRLAMRALGEELTALEERQVGFDRRMSEMSGLVQALKEGHDVHRDEIDKGREHAQKLERAQRTLARSTQRALEEAVSAQQQLEEVQLEEEFNSYLGNGVGGAIPILTFPTMPSAVAPKVEQNADLLANMVHSLEARFDRGITDVSKRVDALYNEKDKHIADVRTLARQVPEVMDRVEQLSTQCEHHFAKVQEYSVHFGFFRTSFEAHRQQVLEAMHQLRQQRGGHSTTVSQQGDEPFDSGSYCGGDTSDAAAASAELEESRQFALRRHQGLATPGRLQLVG
mmetsp:Transcript_31264/g.71386  ORF Transcript_31264/g.71386 Transcript_31264/m.71386 type:complete len:328 (+) Transcript_31264:45-1028(+)